MCWWMGATPPVIYSTLQLRTVVRLHCCFRYLCELTPNWGRGRPPHPRRAVLRRFLSFMAFQNSNFLLCQSPKCLHHKDLRQLAMTTSMEPLILFLEMSTRFKGVKGSLTLMKNSGRGWDHLALQNGCLRTIESISWDLSRALRFIFDLLCERYSVQTIFNQNIFRFDLNLVSSDL